MLLISRRAVVLANHNLGSPPAHEAGALRILKPLEFDLGPISSLLLAVQTAGPLGIARGEWI